MERVPRPLIEGVREDLLPLVEERRDGAIQAVLLNLHPADIALLISTLHDEEDQRDQQHQPGGRVERLEETVHPWTSHDALAAVAASPLRPGRPSPLPGRRPHRPSRLASARILVQISQ